MPEKKQKDIHILGVHTAEQVSNVARLAHEIWQEHYVPIIGQAQVTYMLNTFQSERAIAEQLSDGYEYYIVVYDAENVGYIAVLPNVNDGTLKLSKIYVKKSFRGLRIGCRMMQFVEELCLKQDFGKIWLTVNKNNKQSIEWYQRMGFTVSKSIVQHIGQGFVMDDYRMEKDVSHPPDKCSQP